MLKTTTEINARNKLSFIAMFNPETYKRTLKNVLESKNLNDDNNSNFIGRSKVSKAVAGLNLRTLTGKSSYWKNILYFRMMDVNNDLGYSNPVIEPDGDIVPTDKINFERDLRKIENKQQEVGYRSIFTQQGKHISFTAGTDVARVNMDYNRRLKHTDTLYSFCLRITGPIPHNIISSLHQAVSMQLLKMPPGMSPVSRSFLYAV